jgi:hypothetical protein
MGKLFGEIRAAIARGAAVTSIDTSKPITINPNPEFKAKGGRLKLPGPSYALLRRNTLRQLFEPRGSEGAGLDLRLPNRHPVLARMRRDMLRSLLDHG